MTHGNTRIWHVSDHLAARYAEGTLPEPDAWSLEKHVEDCAGCASRVSRAVAATPSGAVLAEIRAAVLDAVLEPGREAAAVRKPTPVREPTPVRRAAREAGPAPQARPTPQAGAAQQPAPQTHPAQQWVREAGPAPQVAREAGPAPQPAPQTHPAPQASPQARPVQQTVREAGPAPQPAPQTHPERPVAPQTHPERQTAPQAAHPAQQPAPHARPVRPAPPQAPLRHRLARLLWAAGPAVRGAWLPAVLVVAAGALALAYGAGFPGARALLLAVAPVVPVAGIALSYGPHADPLHEIAAATPGGGLRLALTRTVAVLAVSVPLLTLTGLLLPASGAPAAAAWLLPGLALALGTLALASFVGCRAAALLTGGGWLVAVLGPVPAAPGGAAGARLAEQLSRCLDGIGAQSAWAAAAVLSALLLTGRRRAYDRLPGR
ncbi:hypothetical protein ACVB8X_11530 [Streptomyces sp. NRAIS4]